MNTRRSTRLQKEQCKCAESGIFIGELSTDDVILESPASHNIHKGDNTNSSTAITIMETPDSVNPMNKARINKLCKPSSSKSKELENSDVFESTPDLNLKRNKNLLSILESEHSFTKALKTKSGKNSSMIPDINEAQKRHKRKSITETILPFDLNNEKVLAKKLSQMEMKNSNKRSNLSLCIDKTENVPQTKSQNKTERKSLFRSSRITPNDRIRKSLSNMSIEVSSILGQEIQGNTVTREHERSKKPNETVNVFENSNLELTDANCDINVIQSIERSSSYDLLSLNLSLTNEKESSNKENEHFDVVGNGNCSFRNFSTMSCKEYEKKIQNQENSLVIESQTPMSKFNNTVLGEYSPVNKLIFDSDISLSPTQPISILTLQGVTAFVDVRNGAENRSAAFKEVLLSLGAVVEDRITSDVTHVIFRDGSKSVYQRAIQRKVHLVSPLWVDACKVKLVRVSEALFPISTEYVKNDILKKDIPRKLKSMQPRDMNEEMVIAEIRMKRKKRLQSGSSSNSEEVLTPPFRESTHKGSEAINSPLFGIAHLLTPTRECRDESSASSSEKSSTEKDYSTPLATRMLNKYYSPRGFSLVSPSKRFRKTCHEQERRDCSSDVSNNVNTIHSEDTEDNSSSVQRIGDNTTKNSECPLNAEGEVLDNAERSLNVQRNDAKVQRKRVSFNNNNNSEPRHASELEGSANENKAMKMTNRKRSIEVPAKIRRSSRRLTISKRNVDSTNGIREKAEKSTTSSLPSCSSVTSFDMRRRRLHTVDVDGPSQDLIIPLTPTTPSRNRKAGIYDTLKQQTGTSLSQIKQLKQLEKKTNGELKYVPLPSTSKRREKQICSKSRPRNGLVSPVDEEKYGENTPKRRVSLAPRKRHSIEEFQMTFDNGRRRTRNRRIRRSSSLPSICVTSVHSSNMGSIVAIIKSLGGFNLTTDVDTSTTHVVCGSERRTINVLAGISRGSWILDISWLYESVELLQWAPEEPFELFNFAPGARISRVIREDEVFRPSLFAEAGRIYISESCSPPPYVIQCLLLNCGANVSSTLRSADLLVGTQRIESPIKQLSVTWILDSIQFWEMKNPDDYLL